MFARARQGRDLPVLDPNFAAVRSFKTGKDAFFFAVILTRAEVTTLPFILPTLMEGYNVFWDDIVAIATIGAMPVIVLAFILQKYRVRRLSFGTLRE